MTAFVYVLTGHTESGDDLHPMVWDYLPSKQEVSDYLKETYPEEFVEVGFIDHTIRKCRVESEETRTAWSH